MESNKIAKILYINFRKPFLIYVYSVIAVGLLFFATGYLTTNVSFNPTIRSLAFYVFCVMSVIFTISMAKNIYCKIGFTYKNLQQNLKLYSVHAAFFSILNSIVVILMLVFFSICINSLDAFNFDIFIYLAIFILVLVIYTLSGFYYLVLRKNRFVNTLIILLALVPFVIIIFRTPLYSTYILECSSLEDITFGMSFNTFLFVFLVIYVVFTIINSICYQKEKIKA